MAKSDNLTDFLTDIADSLRTKKGTTEKINPQDFSTEILNLPTNEKFKSAVNKTITAITESDLEGVTSIGRYTFWHCMSLTDLTIPDGVTYIGDYAFWHCENLIRVTIGNSVASISPYAFFGCKNLTYLVIPDSVKNMGEKSLFIGSSTNKATIRMLSTTPPAIQSTLFDSSKLDRIIVPIGSLETYKTATNWNLFADYIVEEA